VFIIDAAAMMKWCFEDERPPNAEALMKRLVAAGMAAPAIFPLEIINTLWVAERKKRLTAQQSSAFIALVEGLRIEIDAETPWRAWSETRELSRREGLSAYDAAYLELAIRRQASLASFDKSLLKAARANKVPVLEIGPQQ